MSGPTENNGMGDISGGGSWSAGPSYGADKQDARHPWQDRYSRQTRFAPIGAAGQRKLGEACVLIVGCGALGASLAQHMVRAGVGVVRIVDRDYVEPSNLQRQILFDEEDALAAWPKAVAAANKLRRINSEIRIEHVVADVTAANARELVEGTDLVLDGTDNAATRLLLSDLCFSLGIPFLYGGVAGARGMSALLVPGETACLRCLIGAEADDDGAATCDTVGVISPAVEWIAALQAAEALKWLTGNHDSLRGTWLTGDLWQYRMMEAALPRPSDDCSFCGKSHRRPKEAEAVAPEEALSNRGNQHETYQAFQSSPSDETYETRDSWSEPVQAAALCGRDTVQVTMGFPVSLQEMQSALTAAGCQVAANPYLVRAQLKEGERLVVFPDGRILVQGTQDVQRAASLCSQYVTSKMSKEVERQHEQQEVIL